MSMDSLTRRPRRGCAGSLLLTFAGSMCASAWMPVAIAAKARVTGAVVAEAEAVEVLYVDLGAQPGGDGRTPERALKTFRAGIAAAAARLQGGRGVRLRIAPGVYREGNVHLDARKWSKAAREAVLVVESSGEAPVVVSGSDDWSGRWRPVADSPGVYEADWPHDWGMGLQWWENYGVLIPPAASRREMVFVNGQLMAPVLLEQYDWHDPDGPAGRPGTAKFDPDNRPGAWRYLGFAGLGALSAGSFGVAKRDENGSRLLLLPPKGVDMAGATVEVAMRNPLLRIVGKNNVVLRRLTFRHNAGGICSRASCAVVVNGRNLLIEDCAFERNGSRGLALLKDPRDVTLRRCRLNRNGWQGLSASTPDNLLFEDCESSFNNWRGHLGQIYGWDAAAIKIMGPDSEVGVRVVRHTSIGNLTHGFWFDHSRKPVGRIEFLDCLFVDNLNGNQLYIEKQSGPITLRGNVFWNLDGTGGIYAIADHVTLENNVLFSGARRGTAIRQGRRTNSKFCNLSRNWTVRGNVIATAGRRSRLYAPSGPSPKQYNSLLASLAADRNIYFGPEEGEAMAGLDSRPVGMAEWRKQTGQDAASRWLDPGFGDGRAYRWDVPNQICRELGIKGGWRALTKEQRQALRAFREDLARAKEDDLPQNRPARRYRLAMGAAAGAWQQLDLLPHANRTLTGREPWIGLPLTQLRSGDHTFHGVPFSVIDVETKDGFAAVALRSKKIVATEGRPLSARLELSVGKSIQAAYVLHGCGWVMGEHTPVGRYELLYADGSSHAVDIVPAGKNAKAANIQDWHWRASQIDTEHARQVCLRSSTLERPAYLYNLEIPNPTPGKIVKAIRLNSDPAKSTSLMILAATVLSAGQSD